MTYNHLVATLQQRYVVEGKPVILTGLAPTVVAPGADKKPMGFQIKPGTVQLGHQVAARLGMKPGAPLTLGERKLQVAKCLVESGTDDDIRVFGHLEDVQQILGLKGQINEIKAIDCLCLTADQDPLRVLRTELNRVLPEAQIIQLRAIADARARQRQTAERYFGFVTPVLLLVSAGWIGVLAVLNVRERRTEIGVLRALGHGSGRIAGLFLGKAVLVGLFGAGLGFGAGTWLALQYGPEIFQVTAAAIRPKLNLLGWALWAAPAFAAICSFIPAMWAVSQDPAVSLREE
jgi:ABC-type lipoprotein release transport system permease subunit